MSESKFDWKKLLGLIPWQMILSEAYKALRPWIAEKVNDSESKWDDVAFDLLDKLVLKFLPDLLDKEKGSSDLIAEKALA